MEDKERVEDKAMGGSDAALSASVSKVPDAEDEIKDVKVWVRI